MKTLPIIKDIETRLQQALPDFAVELFPEHPEKYRLNHANGAVLIAYHGSDYGEPKATDIAHQQRVIQWRLTVITRSQHNDFGSLAALDAIRLSLLGYRPPHCDKLYLSKEQFDGEDAGLWQYGVSLYCHTQAVEQVTPKDLPTFKQGVYHNSTTQ
ncbi:MAG: Gp37 family protein [Gammaproteobacteria bacterium]|nr:Gp37 family protein [Gammaproteobacteria bacterium]